jgi:hypothetical protein
MTNKMDQMVDWSLIGTYQRLSEGFIREVEELIREFGDTAWNDVLNCKISRTKEQGK